MRVALETRASEVKDHSRVTRDRDPGPTARRVGPASSLSGRALLRTQEHADDEVSRLRQRGRRHPNGGGYLVTGLGDSRSSSSERPMMSKRSRWTCLSCPPV